MLEVKEDINIAPLLWYKLGGKVRYLLECSSTKDILEALEFIEGKNISNILTIGLGSNLIFAEDYFDGAVIQITGKGDSFTKKSSDTVSSFSGEVLDNLIEFTFDNNLVGLEWAGGLPGTVGAGVRGNVGAFGGEIKDTFLETEVAKITNGKVDVYTLSKEDMDFAYRESLVKKEKGTIILEATFILNPASGNELEAAIQVYEKSKNYRKERHPLEYPNCGSVFKNVHNKEDVQKVLSVLPELKEKVEKDWHGKVSMGYLIATLGFTGKRVGGAQVAQKHSNFIVNTGGATGHDVLTLIGEIQQATQEKFDFIPEIEPEVIK